MKREIITKTKKNSHLPWSNDNEIPEFFVKHFFFIISYCVDYILIQKNMQNLVLHNYIKKKMQKKIILRMTRRLDFFSSSSHGAYFHEDVRSIFSYTQLLKFSFVCVIFQT